MKTLRVQYIGIRPLIMSNPQTIDIANRFAVASRALNTALKSARKKGDEDKLLELAAAQKKNDFMASAYFDDKGGFFIPDSVIMASIKSAAQSMRKGKDIDRAVLMEETEAYVKDVPNAPTLEDAFADTRFHLKTPCKVPPKTGALFMKLRCVMPTGWRVEFTLSFDSDVLAEKTLKDILNTAGGFVGIGSWRPKFGRFTVEIK